MSIVQVKRSATRFDAAAQTARSQAWFGRAQQVLAGGVSSSARATQTGNFPFPLVMEHGSAGHITDVDGNTFIDYLLSYGSVILGHAHARVIKAVTQQMRRGSMFGTCNTVEVELAELLNRMVPCAELVRFSNSGSEAVCGAIRAARGYSGRHKILKFEGHYHGWVDVLAVSNRPALAEAGPRERPHSIPHSPGIPPGVVDDVIICPWNDAAACVALLDQFAGEIGCVIAEPIVANNACIMPLPGFLELLRAECTCRDIPLVFDEIVTGFRVAKGGAQEYFSVTPDLAVFSKALGGGTPLSAFVGRKKFMDPIGRNLVKHGGTYNGNPLCAAASLAVLQELNSSDALATLHRHGLRIIGALQRAARDHAIPCCVQGVGSMFQILFGPDAKPARNYRDLTRTDSAMYDRFRYGMLRHGIHINPSATACWFLCAAHTDDDIERTTRAIDATFWALTQE